MSKTIKPPVTAPAQPFSIRLGNKNVQISKEDGICGLILISLLFLVYMIRSNFLSMPFERDEGIYAYNGIQLLKGKIPYVDFSEQKFPGIFYFYALIVYLFGDTVEGLHKGFIYVNLISIVLIYFSVRKMFNTPAALLSAITFSFVSLTPSLSGFTIQSEHASAMFVCLGFLFYAYSDSSNNRLFLFFTGLAFGASFMVKTSGVFLVIWCGLMTIADHFLKKDKSLKNLIIHSGIYSLGVLLVIGIFFLIMVLKGSFDDMIYWTIEVPKKYVSMMTFENGKKYFGYTLDAILLNHKFFWFNAFLSAILLLFKNIPLRIKWLGISLAALSFMTIVPGYYFYGHYWILMIPALSLLGGMSLWGITTVLKDRFNIKISSLPYVYLGIFMVMTLMHLSKQKGYYFHPNKDLIMRQVYGGNPFLESMEIGKFINKNAKPEDEIVVIGSEPQIYVYTRKNCPSKYAYFAALVADLPEHREWQREFIQSVEEKSPKYLVFFRHGISLFVQPNTDNHIFEWLNKYVTDYYHIVGLVDMPDNQMSTYVWNEDVNTYKAVGQNQAYVFERNAPNSQAAAVNSNTNQASQ